MVSLWVTWGHFLSHPPKIHFSDFLTWGCNIRQGQAKDKDMKKDEDRKEKRQWQDKDRVKARTDKHKDYERTTTTTGTGWRRMTGIRWGQGKHYNIEKKETREQIIGWGRVLSAGGRCSEVLPFLCAYCRRGCFSKKEKEEHERTHTGAAIFLCSFAFLLFTFT